MVLTGDVVLVGAPYRPGRFKASLNAFMDEEQAVWAPPGAWRYGKAAFAARTFIKLRRTGPLTQDRGSNLLPPPPADSFRRSKRGGCGGKEPILYPEVPVQVILGRSLERYYRVESIADCRPLVYEGVIGELPDQKVGDICP